MAIPATSSRIDVDHINQHPMQPMSTPAIIGLFFTSLIPSLPTREQIDNTVHYLRHAGPWGIMCDVATRVAEAYVQNPFGFVAAAGALVVNQTPIAQHVSITPDFVLSTGSLNRSVVMVDWAITKLSSDQFLKSSADSLEKFISPKKVNVLLSSLKNILSDEIIVRTILVATIAYLIAPANAAPEFHSYKEAKARYTGVCEKGSENHLTLLDIRKCLDEQNGFTKCMRSAFLNRQTHPEIMESYTLSEEGASSIVRYPDPTNFKWSTPQVCLTTAPNPKEVIETCFPLGDLSTRKVTKLDKIESLEEITEGVKLGETKLHFSSENWGGMCGDFYTRTATKIKDLPDNAECLLESLGERTWAVCTDPYDPTNHALIPEVKIKLPTDPNGKPVSLLVTDPRGFILPQSPPRPTPQATPPAASQNLIIIDQSNPISTPMPMPLQEETAAGGHYECRWIPNAIPEMVSNNS